MIDLSIYSKTLLNDLADASSIVFLRPPGNLGDRLIQAGARRLLRGTKYHEVDIRHAADASADIGIVSGGGGWCQAWHDIPALTRALEGRFGRLIVWPSTFDPGEPSVQSWLQRTKALVYVREAESAKLIAPYINARLAPDTAFFFDFTPYQGEGEGLLRAFRTDRERKGFPIPNGNWDISSKCQDLDHWLHTIAAHSEIHTDRAHVMIAGALLGKRIRYTDSCYHKVGAIAESFLQTFDVDRLDTPATT